MEKNQNQNIQEPDYIEEHPGSEIDFKRIF